jgi:hypothetical protein
MMHGTYSVKSIQKNLKVVNLSLLFTNTELAVINTDTYDYL